MEPRGDSDRFATAAAGEVRAGARQQAADGCGWDGREAVPSTETPSADRYAPATTFFAPRRGSSGGLWKGFTPVELG